MGSETGAGDSATALFYTAPGQAALRLTPLPPLLPGWVEVRTTHSALSRGTERLVLEGRVPPGEYARMRAPHQEGDFPFPVKYGYAAVGIAEAGPPDLLGRSVFCLHPHQTRFRVPAGWAVPVPPEVPPARAVLAANAETALNAIWDARIVPGSRVLVVGLGLLGCLIAGFLSARADLTVHGCDTIARRGAALGDFPVTCLGPADLGDDYDIAFHTSATGPGLQSALEALRPEGTVIELSWFGDTPVCLGLGGAFHARRLTIRSSQVGEVAPVRRPSTPHAARLALALARLADPRLERLITAEVPFADLPAMIAPLLAREAEGIATRIVYT